MFLRLLELEALTWDAGDNPLLMPFPERFQSRGNSHSDIKSINYLGKMKLIKAWVASLGKLKTQDKPPSNLIKEKY